MMLEVTIGEHVAVRFDDEITDQRPTPEVVEDYLNRMARAAGRVWDGMEDQPVTTLTEDDGS